MIQSVELRNFQSHKRTKLNFVNGVNVIVGPSDSGKSAIIRALRFVAWNRPLGDSFKRKGSDRGDECSVTIITDENIEICRQVTPENAYFIGGAESLAFRAFGTSVPDEITAALNMDEINLQQQLDSPFLLSKTSGEVAQHFNKIANLSKIDTATSNVKKWISQLESTIKINKAKLEKTEKELLDYDHIEKLEAEVEVIEIMETKSISLTRKKDQLQKILSRYEEVKKNIDKEDLLLKQESKVTELLKLYQKKDSKVILRDDLNDLVEEIKGKKVAIKKYDKVLSLGSQITTLLGYFSLQKQKEKEYTHLQKIIQQTQNAAKSMKQLTTTIITTSAEFEKAMGEVCILCGQSIKKVKK